MLAPGGIVAVWSYAACEVAPAVDELLRCFYAVTLGHYWPAERRYVETGYRTLAFLFEELPVPSLVIEAALTLDELAAYLGTWSAVLAFRAAHGDDPVSELRREIEPHWGPCGERRLVRWPLGVRVGRV